MKKVLLVIAFAAVCLAAFWPRPVPQQLIAYDGVAMTVPYRIVVGDALSSEQQEQVLATITTVFTDVHLHLNHWNPDSEISQLNKLAQEEQAALSPLLYHFLQEVDEWVALSEGRFDPTIGPARDLWLSHLKEGTTPPADLQQSMHNLVGWSKIHISNGLFSKDNTGVQMNADSVAKGYAVDMLHDALLSQGLSNFLVDWGGEFRAHGAHPRGRPWQVYIRGWAADGADNALAIVPLEDVGLATSGDYYQQWSVPATDGTATYCHIFDPRTARPLLVSNQSIASGSIQAPSCAMADALATALLTWESPQQAELWIQRVQQKHPGVKVWVAARKEQ